MSVGLLHILYNSECPVCEAGITRTERRTSSAASNVVYFDVAKSPEQFVRRGVELDHVRRKIHAIRPDGELLIGWPAISALWRRTPGFGWLAVLGDLPGLNYGAKAAYHLTSLALYQWNRLSGRW